MYTRVSQDVSSYRDFATKIIQEFSSHIQAVIVHLNLLDTITMTRHCSIHVITVEENNFETGVCSCFIL